MDSGESHSKARQTIGIAGAVLAVTLILANANSIFGLLTAVFPIGNTGVIASANLKVYWESGCTNEVTSVNWGTLSPGDVESVTLYVKNTGSVDLTLSKSTDDWSPASAETYLTLTWSYAGEQIEPNGVLSATLTLTVSESITGISSFSFNIYITGTEAT